jgi:hypothetical protein
LYWNIGDQPHFSIFDWHNDAVVADPEPLALPWQDFSILAREYASNGPPKRSIASMVL